MSRVYLQNYLESIGLNAYFQPPENIKIKYPCVIYSLDTCETKYANNNVYSFTKGYKLLLIHKDPDNSIVDVLIKSPLCSFVREYVSDGLHHYIFTKYA